jgi:hypothetical protein
MNACLNAIASNTHTIQIGRFFRDVVSWLVMKDFQFLLERYLRKMRKSFARLPEMDLGDDDDD